MLVYTPTELKKIIPKPTTSYNLKDSLYLTGLIVNCFYLGESYTV